MPEEENCTTAVPSDTFQSPGYPDRYSNNVIRDVIIVGTGGELVDIVFDEFDLEFEQNCSYDSLQVIITGLGSGLASGLGL